MKMAEALRRINDLTAEQWGMVTTAQAEKHGITRLQLSRLAEDGHLERLAHGIYQAAGVPTDRFSGIRAAWLSTNPKDTALQRLSQQPLDAVVSGPSAAYLLGLGDLVPEPYQFTVPIRRQTQRTELSFQTRYLPPESVTIRQGLPVTTVEQTIADLVEARFDRSLVADILAEADAIDRNRLDELLAPLAKRNGFNAANGTALRAELERLAHRDPDSLASLIARTQLAPLIVDHYAKIMGFVQQAASGIAANEHSVKDMIATVDAAKRATSALDWPLVDTLRALEAIDKVQLQPLPRRVSQIAQMDAQPVSLALQEEDGSGLSNKDGTS